VPVSLFGPIPQGVAIADIYFDKARRIIGMHIVVISESSGTTSYDETHV